MVRQHIIAACISQALPGHEHGTVVHWRKNIVGAREVHAKSSVAHISAWRVNLSHGEFEELVHVFWTSRCPWSKGSLVSARTVLYKR